ncbi:MAG: TonB-dependent receptor [Acidobacteria bacterium]|nr:TonB-dependent receptor [Acidobacteriota bacterium]
MSYGQFYRLRTACRIAAVLGAVLAAAPLLCGQATLGSATISGTVRDQTGLAAPQAKVVLSDTARGFSRESATNESGAYIFPNVPAGDYALQVTKEGFEAQEVKNIRVQVGQVAELDVTLSIGRVSTVVSVSGEQMTLIETESNVVGTVVDSERVQSLPLNGRNFLQLALIAAGSNEVTGRADVYTGQVGHPSRAVAITGNMVTTTGYTVNGIATRGGRLGESALNLSVAAIDQFKVQQNFFMPDQGPNPGLVNVTTTGGNNAYHGQAFEFLRNRQLDARNFFAPSAEDLKRNQFGFALGGPIRKDKAWFYGYYEGLREITAFSARAYTPTPSMFRGDFREVAETIYDPQTYSAASGTRLPFPNQTIPDNRFNAVSKNLLKYYLPGSSLAQRPSNLFANPSNRLDDDQWGFRLDTALAQNQSLFAQVLREDSPAVRPGIFPLSGAFYPNTSILAMVQHNWTIRPTLVNTLRAGFTRNVTLFANEGRTAGNILGDIGILNTFDDRGVSSVGLQGYSGFGRSNGDLGNIDNNYQLDEGMNWAHGEHNFQYGMSLRYRRTWQQNANAGALGSVSFQPAFTAQLTRNAQGQFVPQTGTGNSFADFLLGTPLNATLAGLAMFQYRFTQYMPYFQDTWRITRDLTLNYGISWFLATIPDPQGRARQFVHGFHEQTGLLTYAALRQLDPRVLPMDKNNLTPRLGLAWRPSFLPNTVIRAAAGMYYSDSALIEMQFAMVAPPFNTPFQLFNPLTEPVPAYRLGLNIFPRPDYPPLDQNFAAGLPSGTTAFRLKEDGRSPYVSQWNLSIQHSIGNNDAIELVYVGNSAHRLQNRYDFAQCRPGSDLRCDPATKPYPRFAGLLTSDFNGNSSYNALFAKYNHRAGAGLNLRLEYTFSKALADGWESGSATESQITICRRCDKGYPSFDVRHRLVASTIYTLPFGRGRKLGRNMAKAADFFAGGWTLTGITTFSAGVPIFLTSPATTSSIYIAHRPNRLCDGADDNLASNLRNNGLLYFRTSCFVAPPAGYFGNTGLDPLHGPGINNWDAGVEKEFPIPVREAMRLQFRGEFFNAFNHTQFGNPSADTGAGPNFGRVAGARSPRLVQFALKLLW